MKLPNYDNQHMIFGLIFMLSNQLQTIGDTFFDEITTKQWFVISVLNIMDGYEPTLNELAAAVGSSHQNVKQLVLKLEQKGFLLLRKDSQDTRRLRISMTSKCEDFKKANHERSEEFLRQMFQNISSECLDATFQSLLKMKENLESRGTDDGEKK